MLSNINDKQNEETLVQKTKGKLHAKQGIVVCTIKLQKNKEVSAGLLFGTLHKN